MDRLRDLYQLTKPGIIRGNAVHVLAGAFLASIVGVEWGPILAVLLGTSLVIASACVVNNYMDRNMDAKMKRTKTRPSVTGSIPLSLGMAYAVSLLVLGFWILATYTNLSVVIIGILAYVLYVFLYGWAKRHTEHSTIVGAIPGALPAMAGYVAVDGSVTLASALVFLVVFAWQMPHFYAISIFRRKDYHEAGVPVLGVVRPFPTVRRYIFTYMFVYLLTIVALIATQTVSPPAGVLLLAGAAYWLGTFKATDTRDQDKWARSIFGSSLVLTLGLLLASILNVFVPPVA